MEELDAINSNYTHLVNEVEDIIKDINSTLSTKK
jgi:hypothetical protein